MIKFLRFTAIFLTFWSCSSTSGELSNYFESTQITELNQLTEFVVNELTADCEGNRTDCLKSYFDQFKNSGYDFELGISKSKQAELLNSLSESTYDNIWSTCRGTRSFSRDSVVNILSICPNMKGGFTNFLTSYCAKTDRLTSYGDAFEQAGSYSPAMNAQLIKNPDSFNFNSEAELLLISVHLITLNNEDKIVESVPNKR
ncbi:hypothetical protein [Marinoscillum sp. MHG1-6]|uniref:hypothetical protein n=1 Tax=Marinoscillum sp. MHG1-6 TaxID=2959627 RepID=UPI0021574571|nr:hypothetical protein [Marinoscillum sp. MHG1-6]